MPLTKSKPQQPARQRTKPPAKPAKTISTASTSLKSSNTQQAASKKKASKPHQNVPKAVLSFTTTAPKSTEAEELVQVHSLLAQIWNRNKNQHHGQKWWKWVSLLKRAVRDLVELAVGTGEEEKIVGKGKDLVGEAARVRKRMELVRVRREKRAQLEKWLREVVIGRCWLAFSTLVADRQFSNLGVVLLAILARVGKLVGLPEPARPAVSDLNPAQQADNIFATSLKQTVVDRGEVVERVFVMSDREAATEASTSRPLNENPNDDESQKRKLTVGNGEAPSKDTHSDAAVESPLVVADMGDNDDATTSDARSFHRMKSKVSNQLASETIAHNASGATSDKTPATSQRKMKRRKKGNTIDELFAGLS